MNTLSIKEYAVAHKISIYNVVKMTKNGSLQTEIKKVNGKDEVFILDNEGLTSQETLSENANEEEIGDYKKAYFKLKIKYDQLKIKHEKLQKKSDSFFKI